MVWLKRESLDRRSHRVESSEEPELAVTPVRVVERKADGGIDHAQPVIAHPAGVLDKIRRLIQEGHFPPGSKLPPERALAVQLGVGRPSLREAIKALSVLDVLESRRGAGTFVKSREPLASWWPVVAEAETEDFGVLQIVEVRKMLEPRAAWLAATRASEHHLLEIEAARRELEKHDQDWRLVAKLDHELHSAIIRGAQNPVLDLINRFLILHVFGSRSLAAGFAPDVERMRRDHQAIVESILKRQAEAAEEAMIDHLNSLSLDFISEGSR